MIEVSTMKSHPVQEREACTCLAGPLFRRALLLAALIALWTGATGLATAEEALAFKARFQAEKTQGSGIFEAAEKEVKWNPRETAVIICDMWDKHWCDTATERVGQMVPRMNRLVKALRDQGVLIVHAPSDTLDVYKDTPQRKRAQSAPEAPPPVEVQGWASLDPNDEAPLPIDDSDEGCDSPNDCKPHRAWSQQHPGIEIADSDAISEDGREVFNMMQARGIDNVVMMGVHTNMCVLGRSFGIRQMTRMGKNVVLVRDLTDTMYNPKMYPYVEHDRGTELVVEHIEKYWCPSVESEDILDEIQ